MSLADSSSAGPRALTVGPVLYDQLNGQATTNPADISSQDFETSLDAADSEAADDFVVPAGLTWSIDGIDVDGEYFSRDGLDPVPAGFHVRFWSNDAATNLPSALSAERLSQPYTAFGTALGDVQVGLDSPVVLPAGTWWVSVQARLDYGPGTHQWFWHNRIAQSGQGAAWQNPGDLLQTHCVSFARRSACQGTTDAPDQVFALHGTAAPAGAPPPPPPPPPPAAAARSASLSSAQSRGQEARAGNPAHPASPLQGRPDQPPEVGPSAARQGARPEPARGPLAAVQLTREARRRPPLALRRLRP